jgi:hypothetical protein
VAAVSRARIALLGDEGKFVPDGRKRIAALDDEPDRLAQAGSVGDVQVFPGPEQGFEQPGNDPGYRTDST